MPRLAIKIIHEDRDLIVVNKPEGLLTVPIPGSRVINLFDILKQEYPQSPIYVVHRIDRYTSGIVLFARSKTGFLSLKKQFTEHTAQRMYLAVVKGRLEHAEGTLEHTLKQVKSGFKNILTSEKDPAGTPARLHYRLVEAIGEQASIVEIMLDTGLKNQIRVQFSAIQHPILGDRQYGEPSTQALIARQALHASALGVVHPRSGQQQWYKSPIPKDITLLISQLKRLD
jgi:23S rRNA pseudouridine1911/1915/1917 synthase